MKFTCGNCSTGYSVPDEKVRGKRVRITCRKCGTAIVIEGRGSSFPPTAQPPPQDVKPVRSMMKTQLGLQAPTPQFGSAAAPVAGPRAPGQVPAAPAHAMPVLSRAPAPATRLEDPEQPAGQTKSSAPRLPASSTLREEDDRWSVAVNRRDPRKMTTEQVAEALASGLINDHTLVWKRGMDAWKPLAWVPSFSHVAGKRADSEPPPTPVRPSRSEPAANAVAPAPAPVSGQGSPQSEPLSSSDFDDEPTAIIDPARAQALLSGKDVKPPAPAARAEPIPRPNVEPPQPPRTEPTTPGNFDEDEDIARDATSKAAQELLRGTPEVKQPPAAPEPSVVVSPDAEKPEPVAPPPPQKVPSNPPPVSDSTKRTSSRPPSDGKRASYHPPVQVSIQNEATRIVRVKSKKGRKSMIIGLLIVAVASAAGGFLASRFLAPGQAHAPAGAPTSAQ